MNEKIKVLIGDNTPEHGLRWASILKRDGFFTAARPNNGRTILKAIIEDMPDILIISTDMREPGAVELLAEVSRYYGRLPITIAVSDCADSETEREVMDAGASHFMTIPDNPEIMAGMVKALYSICRINPSKIRSDREHNRIDRVVTDIIHSVGIPAHIKGYHYLRTAIILSFRSTGITESVTREIYPAIAIRYETTSSRVERAMRHAIEIAWQKGDSDVLYKLFRRVPNSLKDKPTNSEFIARITDELRLSFLPDSLI